MDYATITIAISVLGAILSLGATLVLIGKWIGTKDYLHKEIESLHKDLESLGVKVDGNTQRMETYKEFVLEKIESIKDNAKEDRHALRKELMDKMREYWEQQSKRLEEMRIYCLGQFPKGGGKP